MTERQKLSDVAQQFILHWGEMSSRWGINRSMAQIHALLYLSPRPLTAEEIADTLQIARSNVSTSLRELLAWGVVRLVHQLGDRRDHFETMKDAWEMFRVILEQRKRREIDPTIGMLKDCLAGETEPQGAYALDRMQELLTLLMTLSGWYDDMTRLPPSLQRKVLRMGSRIRKLAG